MDTAIIEVKRGSNRNFGLVFSGVFLLVALFPLLGGGNIRWWSAAIALLLLAITLLKPDWLTKPNLYWFKFGMFLGAFIAPIVMGLVFLLTILPMGLVFRALGKDPLRLKIDKQAKSYWLKRETPPHSMKNQF